MGDAPEEAKRMFQGAVVSLNPYAKAVKLNPFGSGVELMPGIRGATRGHAVGHNAFIVKSKRRKLALWGNPVHVGAMRFAQRKKAYADTAKRSYLGQARIWLSRTLDVCGAMAKLTVGCR